MIVQCLDQWRYSNVGNDHGQNGVVVHVPSSNKSMRKRTEETMLNRSYIDIRFKIQIFQNFHQNKRC